MTELPLDLALTHRAGCPRAAHGELELGQTLDGAALGADEVRVRHLVTVGDGLEPPHVIADIRATRETSLREIDQVAIDRRAVPHLCSETIRDVAVGHRRGLRAQQLEHGQPRRRCAEIAGAERGPQLVDVLRHDPCTIP